MKKQISTTTSRETAPSVAPPSKRRRRGKTVDQYVETLVDYFSERARSGTEKYGYIAAMRYKAKHPERVVAAWEWITSQGWVYQTQAPLTGKPGRPRVWWCTEVSDPSTAGSAAG